MRMRPAPRSMRISVLSTSCSCGVSVPRTSSSVAKAVTISDTGAVTCLIDSAPLAPSAQRVRIDSESLPTGTPMPNAGHSSMATALTVSYSAASSPGSPQAAIQLQLSLTRSSVIGAASRLVMASATAMRPEAGASRLASGVRSPMAMASPRKPSKSASVTAQSATGSCHGPTIGSRWLKPPTVRSPMVMRKRLLATVGWRSTSKATCSSFTSVRSSAASRRGTRTTSRCIFGTLPSNTSIGMSMTRSPPGPSSSTSWRSALTTPTTAKGQRSRVAMAWKIGRLSLAIAST